jgi:hypothetical protein
MHDVVVEDVQLVLQQATAAATAADGVRSNTPNESPKTVVLLESVATPFGFVNWKLATGASKLKKVDRVPTAATVREIETGANSDPNVSQETVVADVRLEHLHLSTEPSEVLLDASITLKLRPKMAISCTSEPTTFGNARSKLTTGALKLNVWFPVAATPRAITVGSRPVYGEGMQEIAVKDVHAALRHRFAAVESDAVGVQLDKPNLKPANVTT